MAHSLIATKSTPLDDLIFLLHGRSQNIREYEDIIDKVENLDYVSGKCPLIFMALAIGDLRILQLFIIKGADYTVKVGKQSLLELAVYQAKRTYQNTSQLNSVKFKEMYDIVMYLLEFLPAEYNFLPSLTYVLFKRYYTCSELLRTPNKVTKINKVYKRSLKEEKKNILGALKTIAKQVGKIGNDFLFDTIVNKFSIKSSKIQKLLIICAKNNALMSAVRVSSVIRIPDLVQKLLIATDYKNKIIQPVYNKIIYYSNGVVTQNNLLDNIIDSIKWSYDLHRYYPYTVMDQVLYMLMMYKYGPVDMNLPWDILEMIIKKIV